MEGQFFALAKLEDVILKTCLLVHYEEICLLRDPGVNIKEELVINVAFNRIFEVICREIGVWEGEIENLISQKLIYLYLRFACDPGCYSGGVIRIWSCILTFPELDLKIIHLIAIEVPVDVIFGFIIQALVFIDSILLDLHLIHIVEILIATLSKI